jgi:hypothetical protein
MLSQVARSAVDQVHTSQAARSAVDQVHTSQVARSAVSKHAWLILLCALLLSVSQAQAAEVSRERHGEQLVQAQLGTHLLIVDSQKAEAQSKVMARLLREAHLAQKASGQASNTLDAKHQEALELSQSAWRQAMKEAAAQVAKAKKADVVIEPAVAQRYKITAPDATAAVVLWLDQRFASAKFIKP